MNEQQETEAGKLLAEFLHLQTNDNGRIDTAWGDKTYLGLYRTVARFYDGSLPELATERNKQSHEVTA